MTKPPLIVIAGPTACGKSDCALRLAEILDTEIVSCDSVQVYRHMDIGSAKLTRAQMRGIRHHLIDEVEPNRDFSVAAFAETAAKRIAGIHAKGRVPILCGGTGFYINAVLKGNEFDPEDETPVKPDAGLREELRAFALENGNPALHDRLREADPEAADAIHENNVKRVVRALEFFLSTGRKISMHNKVEKSREPIYNHRIYVLAGDRQAMYSRIEQRVGAMIQQGLVGEVENLRKMGCGRELNSQSAIGYKEIHACLDGETSLAEAIDLIKKNTRNYAKRQLTWFSHQLDGEFLDIDANSPNGLADYIEKREGYKC
jgi:tRNA dimethylallyltransferase